jgi:hypothetical protein
MLIFRSGTWRDHIIWFIGTVSMCVAAALWYRTEYYRIEQRPGGSSLPGFTFGLAGGAIIVFEFLLGFRKTFRSVRVNPFGPNPWLKAVIWPVLFIPPLLLMYSGFLIPSATLGFILIVAFLMQFGAKHWMKAHIWLGVLSVPLLILHSGFHFWNLALSGILMAVFLIVIVSGLWGLVLQQKLPTQILDEVPAEQIHSQIDNKLEQDLRRARRLVESACGEGLVPPPGPALIRQFFTLYVVPFLETKKPDRSQLGPRERSAALFRDLRARLDPAEHVVVLALEDLCDRRRQLAKQAKLHNCLHAWVCVHLPLSVALLALLVLHIYFSLKYF